MYLWVKVFHIIFVTSWMMGLLYTPRLLVNYSEVYYSSHLNEINEAILKRLALMARRLLMFSLYLSIPAILSGLYLWIAVLGVRQGAWLHIKLTLVLILIGYHHGCYRLLSKALQGSVRSVRWYKLYNEIPIVLMTAIVALVLFKQP